MVNQNLDPARNSSKHKSAFSGRFRNLLRGWKYNVRKAHASFEATPTFALLTLTHCSKWRVLSSLGQVVFMRWGGGFHQDSSFKTLLFYSGEVA